jgi:hypothetical protein
MGLKISFDGNWQRYWDAYSDVNVLKEWSADMDPLLHRLEDELGIKLLARDHFEIILALENRIEELERENATSDDRECAGTQRELFAA